MPKNANIQINRGRVQAQGMGVEESYSWSESQIPSKSDGHDYLNNLKKKLASADLKVRDLCFKKAEKWVNNAPVGGYVVVCPIKTSFTPCPPMKDVRVDGELFSGLSFKDI